ncbi:hypothetical protein CRG98_016363 [Punica granatum]|uniref:Uncharacterized protein n=1 Tax=Punica granatum TaxID=22663 RepID=A0A2I0K3Q5_PUNGR|nr:hypothetical protein CRG98_016363 [Punica granatum]
MALVDRVPPASSPVTSTDQSIAVAMAGTALAPDLSSSSTGAPPRLSPTSRCCPAKPRAGIPCRYPPPHAMHFPILEVVGSCNGIACLSGNLGDLLSNFRTPVFIWNPATRESRALPQCEDLREIRRVVSYGSEMSKCWDLWVMYGVAGDESWTNDVGVERLLACGFDEILVEKSDGTLAIYEASSKTFRDLPVERTWAVMTSGCNGSSLNAHIVSDCKENKQQFIVPRFNGFDTEEIAKRMRNLILNTILYSLGLLAHKFLAEQVVGVPFHLLFLS